ncbi:molybdopterin dinucleotide binding domain-containing protein [uncultured Methanocorpusculum sp.]|nr:molybdopterin dinucleotide binding domain-containing protein [uncultured Methanocorpusculum sp.]
MTKLHLNMVTQRAVEEGEAMESGKTTQKYFDVCSLIEMNADDIKEMDINLNTVVKVTSECGEVYVRAVIGRQTCPPGLCHIRQGVWANQVVPPRTQSTGEPQYSGFPVTVEPAPEARIVLAVELIQKACNKWNGKLLWPM